MFREASFKFKVLAPQPIDNGIINPEFLSKSAYAAGLSSASKFDAGRFAAFEKVLPGGVGPIDGIPGPDIFGADWGF